MEVKVSYDLEFDEKQTDAIELGNDTSKRLVAVSGPAGSGKTTIIRLIHENCRRSGISVALAAPTGKAARRIKEATGIDAVTVHKLLEYNRPGERDEKTGEPLDDTRPKRTRMNPLDYKMVIVDEYAMINNELHNNLMAAMPTGGCVRAFGDVNQLPPIEKYEVTDSRKGPQPTPFEKLVALPTSVTLDKVYRQGEGSDILNAANKIRQGHTPPLDQDVEREFSIKFTNNPVDELKMFVRQQMALDVNFAHIENQIIVPTRKTWVGTTKLNAILRTLLNPNPAQQLDLPRHKWNKDACRIGLGDKIVCTSNTYDLRPYFERYEEWDEDMRPIMHSYIPCPLTKQMLNGETGIVTQIYPDGGIDVDFGDRVVEIPAQYEEYWSKRDTVIDTFPLRDVDLAYALTTHKCQGSEFDNVCYVLNKSSAFSQSRQNFYTAVTRAKKSVRVITDQMSIRTSVYKVKKG